MITGTAFETIGLVSFLALAIMNIALLACQVRIYGSWSKMLDTFRIGFDGDTGNEFSDIMKLYKSHQLENPILLKYLHIYSFAKWICFIGLGLIFVPPITLIIISVILKLFGAG